MTKIIQNKKAVVSDRLKELKRLMASKFEYSFGHSLTDQEREQNWEEYQKLRSEYLSEFQRLSIVKNN